MAGEVKIRKATKKDFNDIAKIMMKESAKEPYNENYSIKRALKEITEFSKNELYVAIFGKELVGFIASYNIPEIKNKAYINELWLKPNHQRKGIGMALVEFVEDIYKKKGIVIIRLTAKKKAGAFKFYKKMKYKEDRSMAYMEKRLK